MRFKKKESSLLNFFITNKFAFGQKLILKTALAEFALFTFCHIKIIENKQRGIASRRVQAKV